ncbi:MAG: ATP-binding protein [Candidatus Omnitrophota bacterium]
MDINIAITRTGILFVVSAIVLGIPFFLVKWFYRLFSDALGPVFWSLPLLGIVAFLASVGPFIYIYLNRKAERALLREQRRYQDILKHAAIGMTRIRDLHKLVNLIVHIVTKTVKISHSAIYLFDQKSEQFLLEAGRNVRGNQITSINKNSTLMLWFKEHPVPFIYEEVQRRAQENPNLVYREIEEQMRELNAAVIIPSLLETKILGFLVLGEKRSKRTYSDSDLEVFYVLASQAALAIENARFILEARFIQEQIAHTEKMATIGTMADGLSHQINNRFHALSLITEDTVDTMKRFDISAYAAPLQDVFSKISYALGRIQANVQQGGDVVEGMLKYTRKGGHEREPLSLERVLDGTLDMLRYKIKLEAIDIVREFSQDIPTIKGNLVQLQEVFFNLMDNAYDSMMERKAAFQEEGYRGKIIIKAEEFDLDFLRITIEDNGMGVKKEDQKKIFTPFFTTKISSHKGTGLGLYVIRRIIVDMHEGGVGFESEYKRGTRFLIDLPIIK